jgi:hypothetical protein
MRRDLGYIEGHPLSTYRRPSDTGTSEAEDRYRADYSRRYRSSVWPRVGGSLPGQGLRDADLPQGLRYLDTGYILSGLAQALKVPANKVYFDRPDRDIPEADRAASDGFRLGAWLYVRLGAWFTGDEIPLREEVDRLVARYAATPKGILSRWLDIERPSDLRDPAATVALALLWAKAVLSERLGYAVTASDAVGTGRQLAESALASYIAAALQSVETDCAIEKGAWTLGTALFFFLAPQGAIPALLATASSAGIDKVAGDAIDEACAVRKREARGLIGGWRNVATPRQMAQFIRAVYAAGFGVSPESVPDETVSILDAQSAALSDARDIAASVLNPRNDPKALAARNIGRRDRLEAISETFYGVVGCDANVGYLNILADRWEDAGWTEGAPLKKLLTTPSPLTRYVATGAVCAPQILPGNKAALARPSFDYYRRITGKDAPWGVGQARRGSGAVNRPSAPSPVAAVVLGTAAGATVAGPIGAALGLAAGLLIASRK